MNTDAEYNMLRNEIMYYIKSIDDLSVLTYTFYLTITGLAFTTKIYEIFLLPYLLLLPISFKVSDHKTSIAKISAYLKVFCEKDSIYKWETRRHSYYIIFNNSLSAKINYYISSIEYIVMYSISTLLFWFTYSSYPKHIFLLITILQIFICITLVYSTLNALFIPKLKLNYINNWEKLRLTEKF